LEQAKGPLPQASKTSPESEDAGPLEDIQQPAPFTAQFEPIEQLLALWLPGGGVGNEQQVPVLQQGAVQPDPPAGPVG